MGRANDIAHNSTWGNNMNDCSLDTELRSLQRTEQYAAYKEIMLVTMRDKQLNVDSKKEKLPIIGALFHYLHIKPRQP